MVKEHPNGALSSALYTSTWQLEPESVAFGLKGKMRGGEEPRAKENPQPTFT
jgi:hypothetical protein